MNSCAPCNSFCGRTICFEGNSSNLTVCGPCPWGWQNKTVPGTFCSLCDKCDDHIDAYDRLFIVFIALSIYFVHFQSIIRFSVGSLQFMFAELAAGFVEVTVGFVAVILSFSPGGSFDLTACYSSRDLNLKTWYYFLGTVRYISFEFFQETDPDNNECFYETVFPRYSLPLFATSLSIVLTILHRPLFLVISRKYIEKVPPEPYQFQPYLDTLHWLPYILTFYIFFMGFVYFSFPYAFLFISVIALSAYFAAAVKTWAISEVKLHSSVMVVHLVGVIFSLSGIILIQSFPNWVLVLSLSPILFLLLTEPFSNLSVVHAELSSTTQT